MQARPIPWPFIIPGVLNPDAEPGHVLLVEVENLFQAITESEVIAVAGLAPRRNGDVELVCGSGILRNQRLEEHVISHHAVREHARWKGCDYHDQKQRAGISHPILQAMRSVSA